MKLFRQSKSLDLNKHPTKRKLIESIVRGRKNKLFEEYEEEEDMLEEEEPVNKEDLLELIKNVEKYCDVDADVEYVNIKEGAFSVTFTSDNFIKWKGSEGDINAIHVDIDRVTENNDVVLYDLEYTIEKKYSKFEEIDYLMGDFEGKNHIDFFDIPFYDSDLTKPVPFYTHIVVKKEILIYKEYSFTTTEDSILEAICIALKQLDEDGLIVDKEYNEFDLDDVKYAIRDISKEEILCDFEEVPEDTDLWYYENPEEEEIIKPVPFQIKRKEDFKQSFSKPSVPPPQPEPVKPVPSKIVKPPEKWKRIHNKKFGKAIITKKKTLQDLINNSKNSVQKEEKPLFNSQLASQLDMWRRKY